MLICLRFCQDRRQRELDARLFEGIEGTDGQNGDVVLHPHSLGLLAVRRVISRLRVHHNSFVLKQQKHSDM